MELFDEERDDTELLLELFQDNSSTMSSEGRIRIVRNQKLLQMICGIVREYTFQITPIYSLTTPSQYIL